jgi:hypothetical protein
MIVRDRVSGRRHLSGTASVRTHARGRVCRAGDCGTVLSAYNPSSFCALHERALPRPRPAASGGPRLRELQRVLRDAAREATLLQRPLPDGSLRASLSRCRREGT